MADDKSRRGHPDSDLVSMSEDYEVAYWTERLGCTREQLARAVEAVGHSARRIEEYLTAGSRK